MAQDLKINLVTKIDRLEETKNSVISKNPKAFSSNQLAEIESLFERLRNIITTLNPKSNKALDSFNATFGDLVDLIFKGAKTLTALAPEIEKLKNELDELNKTKTSKTERKRTLSSRYDVEEKRMTDSAVKDKVTGADIHYKVAKTKATSYETLEKNVNTGEGTFASKADYEKAKQLVEEIHKEEKSTEEEIKQINLDLAELDKQIQAKQGELGTKIEKAAPEVVQTLGLGNDVSKDIEQQKDVNFQNKQDEQRKKDYENARAEMNSLSQATDKQSTSLGKALKQFSIYAIALRSVKKALNEAKRTVKELDRALTEQAMVTGLTRKQTYGLLKDYQDMASRLGTTTKEVSSTMTQFLRQGRSINESLKLTEAAVSAAKVAGISAADSINYLTTAINGFRLSADDAMKVSDKFAAVAATAATSYEEIAIALSKVAAQANLAGMSIDYTTALLTKGIETTREAPETIGTALKTVIARMREMTDYGETLEGDTNINNVEAQLSYIGIQLRDNNGELRSTEDVLNDLGGQWDTLNANQQAAIAKALAGTRQQSRLIAMMQDYERVIELQQVAERSQGATMAQMATYMEGMDAALNKVSVAWENIVKNVAKSDVIIGLINNVANLMEWIADLLSNNIVLITTILTIGSLLLINLIKRHELQKAQNRLILEENKAKLKHKLLVLQARQAALLEAKSKLAGVKLTQKELKLQAQLALLDKDKSNDFAALQAQQLTALNTTEDELLINKELALVNTQINGAKLDILQTDIQIAQNAAGISEIWGNLATVMQPVMAIMSIINTIQQAYNANIVKGTLALKKDTVEQGKNATVKGTGMFAGIVSAFSEGGIPGVIAGIAIATALVAALSLGIVGIAAASGAFSKDTGADKAAKDINKLSKEIYDLNKKSQELSTVINKFEDLDNKVLKTNKDLEEMHTLLESAGDSLSDEEKSLFSTLTTDQARKEFLEAVKDNATSDLATARNKQRDKINNLRNKGGSEWRKWLTSDDAEIIQSRDAMYALNNAYLYQQVDSLNIDKERAKVIENITQNMLAQLKAEKAAALLANQSQIDTYIGALAGHGDAAETLASEDKTIRERVEAFKELHKVMSDLGDEDILEAFDTVNKEWSMFAAFSGDALDYMDNLGASIDGINELAKAIQKTGVNAETSAQMIGALFEELEHGSDLASTITDLFGSENFDAILNAYDKAFGTTILNMGQNIDKFRNTVNSFYEKSKEWSSMSETDKTSFLSENAELFKGDTGAALLAAFEGGNYAEIEQALAGNAALIKQREQLLKDVNRQLEIEMARSAEKRDNAYIKELEAYKRQLEDLDSVYLASLKMRYEQQQAQLDKYKEYLQKESEALQDALNKRKDAYQKYFEDINKEEEREEYEEKANTLIANISKLSSSTNADAIAKTADLTKQLEDLEKERLKELRQQAQEAVIKGIEDEVTKISDNLEKLLNNEQALLNAMLNDANSPQQMIASMLSAQFASGNNTELGMQSYLQEMQSTFAAIMPGVDWSQVDVERSGDSLVLNILGKEITLTDGEQQTIYDAIQSALKQLGYN